MPVPVPFNKYLLFVIGIISGVIVFLSPGASFFTLILLGFIYFISKQNSKHVTYVFLISVVLRIIFSILHEFAGYTIGIGSDMIGDCVGYSGGGAYVAEVLTGRLYDKSFVADELANLLRFRSVYEGAFPEYNAWRVGGFTYYLGVIYALFGFSPLTVKLINSLMAIATAYMVYRYLLKSYSEQCGCVFLYIFLFMPSLFIWSVSGLKDPIVSFIFTAGVLCVVFLKKSSGIFGLIVGQTLIIKSFFAALIASSVLLLKWKLNIYIKSLFYLISLAVLIISLNFIRPAVSPLFLVIILGLSISYLFFAFYPSRLFKIGFILVIILFPIVFPVKCKQIADSTYKTVTYKTITRNYASREDAISEYQIYPDRYNNDKEMKEVGLTAFRPPAMFESVLMYVKGAGYALFAPFMWEVRSKLSIFSCIESLFLLLSFFCVLNALIFCFSKIEKCYTALPFIIPFFLALVMLSCFEGNVGTLFRHRSMMLPFYCALVAIGIGRKSIQPVCKIS